MAARTTPRTSGPTRSRKGTGPFDPLPGVYAPASPSVRRRVEARALRPRGPLMVLGGLDGGAVRPCRCRSGRSTVGRQGGGQLSGASTRVWVDRSIARRECSVTVTCARSGMFHWRGHDAQRRPLPNGPTTHTNRSAAAGHAVLLPRLQVARFVGGGRRSAPSPTSRRLTRFWTRRIYSVTPPGWLGAVLLQTQRGRRGCVRVGQRDTMTRSMPISRRRIGSISAARCRGGVRFGSSRRRSADGRVRFGSCRLFRLAMQAFVTVP
jgi:hypothetical protein